MLKLIFIPALIASFLIAGCGPSRMKQVDIAKQGRKDCEVMIRASAELGEANTFLGNTKPTPSMMVDSRYPSPKDKEIMARWMDIKVECGREFIADLSKIQGATRDPLWPLVNEQQTRLENIFVDLLSGNTTYGEYFIAVRNLQDEMIRRRDGTLAAATAVSQQQQAAQAQAWNNAFQNAQKSFQNQPSIGSAFNKGNNSVDCVSWVVGSSVTTRCD